MSHPNKELYEFDNFRLDVSERLLTREGERVALSEKTFETLCALVRRANRLVSKEELLNEIWANAIVEENNLDKNISLLRQVLGERTGKGKFIETVRGHGFRFVPEVRKIEEEANAALAFDGQSMPEASAVAGGQTVKESQATNNAKAGLRNFNLPLAAASILIVASLTVIYFWRQYPIEASIKTLAVLPFKPLVGEMKDESLGLGMADALIAKLSGEEITVRPLPAVRRYSSQEQDPVTAGRELGVDVVLDGSIQVSGDRVRVLAKLLRVDDGRQLWAERFDEKFTDIFDVQDSISERVAGALRIQLGSKDKKRQTQDIEAYQLYMKGRYHALRLTRAETDKGIDYFQQAIKLDPNYALAHVGLAEAYVPMALTSGEPSWETMPKAKAAALKALELGETLAEAHAILAAVLFWYDWDWQTAERQLVRALELNPRSAEARFGYAHLLSNGLKHEKAIVEIKHARELDPLSLRTNALEGQILFFAGNYDAALDHLNKTIDLEPNFWLSHLFISRVFTEKGMHQEAVSAAEKAGELSGNSQSNAYRAYALTKWRKLNEARAVLEGLLKLSTTRYVPPYNFAVVYSGLGEREKALDYLEKGYAERDPRMVFLGVEPMWNNLRSDSRFVALIQRMRIDLN
ncbi:MAG TPA: winged helix-turn-helix domain-containing protein [Pyrinomonadaceae bacterium]|nr:winged helix-turn-helix domain-containing protein [Pyrinomonadaceae bacterium]